MDDGRIGGNNMSRIRCSFLAFFPGLVSAGVVHLSHVDHLLASCAGHVFGVALAHDSVVGGFDRVHRVSRTVNAGCKVVDTGGTTHFEDQVLATESES